MKKVLALIIAMCIFVSSSCFAAEDKYTASLPIASDATLNNIRLASESIGRITIGYGQRFSFNSIVGPRTQNRGYIPALNGRGVSVSGGGVAEVASAMFIAMRGCNANVTYTDRYTYGSRFSGEYVTDTADAILVDYASGIDFGFISHEESITFDFEIDETTNTLNCICRIERDTGAAEDDDVVNISMTFATSSAAASGAAENSDTVVFDEGFDEMFAEDVPLYGGWGTGATDNVLSFAAIDVSDSNSATINNISLAADSINGTVLEPGDVFSFNSLVGPRTAKYGFMNAKNGRGVEVCGGGVAQVASVIWLAIRDNACFTILQRATYGSRYTQHYVDSADDAILTDYKAGTDFRFRNSCDETITIGVRVNNGKLECTLYS